MLPDLMHLYRVNFLKSNWHLFGSRIKQTQKLKNQINEKYKYDEWNDCNESQLIHHRLARAQIPHIQERNQREHKKKTNAKEFDQNERRRFQEGSRSTAVTIYFNLRFFRFSRQTITGNELLLFFFSLFICHNERSFIVLYFGSWVIKDALKKLIRPHMRNKNETTTLHVSRDKRKIK